MTEDTLGTRLKEARKRAGLTQSEVARKLGVTYQAVSNYERNKSKVEAGILKRLGILYGVSPAELLGAAVWSQAQRESYAAAQTDADRLYCLEVFGVPEELRSVYQALSSDAAEPERLTAAESALLSLYRRVPASQRALVLDMVQAAVKQQG